MLGTGPTGKLGIANSTGITSGSRRGASPAEEPSRPRDIESSRHALYYTISANSNRLPLGPDSRPLCRPGGQVSG